MLRDKRSRSCALLCPPSSRRRHRRPTPRARRPRPSRRGASPSSSLTRFTIACATVGFASSATLRHLMTTSFLHSGLHQQAQAFMSISGTLLHVSRYPFDVVAGRAVAFPRCRLYSAVCGSLPDSAVVSRAIGFGAAFGVAMSTLVRRLRRRCQHVPVAPGRRRSNSGSQQSPASSDRRIKGPRR